MQPSATMPGPKFGRASHRHPRARAAAGLRGDTAARRRAEAPRPTQNPLKTGLAAEERYKLKALLGELEGLKRRLKAARRAL